MRAGVLCFVGCLLASVAFAAGSDTPAPGRYVWKPTEEALKFYLKHHVQPPAKVLVLNAKGVFEHTRSDEVGVETVLGSYSCDKDGLKLVIETGASADLPQKMRVEGGRILAPGAVYILEKATKEKPVDPPKPPPIPTTELEGVWTLRTNGKEFRGLKLIFTGNEFRYVDVGALEDPMAKISGVVGSSGTFTLTDEVLELTYKVIDGKTLADDAHVHRTCKLTDDRLVILIDNFHFERATKD